MNRNFTHIFLSILISGSLLLNSCAFRIPVKTAQTPTYTPPATVTPSVTLKDGTHVSGQQVRERTPLVGRDKIQVDSQKFLAKDVAFYQTRTNRYANVGGTNFATQFIAGKINMYQFTTTYTTTSYSSAGGGSFHSSTRVRTYNYLQRGGDEAELELYTRKKVKEYVAGSKPAMQLMAQSDKEARSSKIYLFAGIGAALTGFIVAASSLPKFVDKESGGKAMLFTGFGMMAASPLIFIPVFKARTNAQRKAFEAVQAYNRSNL